LLHKKQKITSYQQKTIKESTAPQLAKKEKRLVVVEGLILSVFKEQIKKIVHLLIRISFNIYIYTF